MCTSMSGNKGMECHYEVGIRFCNVLLSSFDFAAVCSITIMMRWPLFWRESREQWNFCREFLPLFGNIFSCFMKRCRGKFLEGTPAVTKKRSGYISIIQLSCVGITKGGGICWTFFWVDLSNVTVYSYIYCISDWIEGMKVVLLHTKFGSGKVYKCNSWGFIPA